MKALVTILATMTDIILVVVIGYGLWLWIFSEGITESVQEFYINIMLVVTIVILITVGFGVTVVRRLKF
ncbi:MAG: hypothetical protein H6632_20115 [Anaerolineales bacterium]|nr:hypothetical protein [Anaerolineales bacterium]